MPATAEFGFIILPVADPLASVAFYERLLGKPPIDAAPTFAMLPLREGVMLGLWQRDGMAPKVPALPGGSKVAFLSDDVDATHAVWAALGTTIVQPPTDMDFGRTFTATDPDGNRLRVFRPGG